MSYGVYESKEAYDAAIAGLHEDFAKLESLAALVEDEIDVRNAEDAGEKLGSVVEVLGGVLGVQDQVATIARVASEVDRLSGMLNFIPDVELGEHKTLIHTLTKSARVLSAFLRGFTAELKDPS